MILRKQNSTGSQLSAFLYFLIPVILGIYWPIYSVATDFASVMLRPAMLGCAFVIFLIWFRTPMTRIESKLLFTLALEITVLLVPSLLATDIMRAFGEWVKLILISIFCVALAKGFRDERSSRWFGYGMLFCSALLTVTLVYFYVKLMGFSIPTYTALRDYKEYAKRAGLMINTLTFTCVFSYFISRCLIVRSWFMDALGVAMLLVSIFLTGSRMPAIIVTASWILVQFAKILHHGKLLPRVLVILTALIILTAGIGYCITTPINTLNSTIARITEGRWDLWYVAKTKFLERPWSGYGYISWRDDLVSRLPGNYALTHELAEQIAGGYHNEFMTALAEQGIFGTFVILNVFYFMLRCGWQLSQGKASTWKYGDWALFAGLFMTLRANVEVPGLFGYAQEPADYTAFIFLALVVSRLSIEEDAIRAAWSQWRRNWQRQQDQNMPRKAVHG